MVQEKIKEWFANMEFIFFAFGFFLFSISTTFAAIFYILLSLKVVWPDHSHAMNMAFRIYALWQIPAGIGAAIFLILGWKRKKKCSYIQNILFFFIVVTCFFSLFWAPLLYATIFLFLGYAFFEKPWTTKEENLSIGNFFHFIGNFFVLFSFCALLACLLEAKLSVIKFAGTIFPMTSFWNYVGFNLSLSVVFAGYITILGGTVLFLFAYLLRFLQKSTNMKIYNIVFCFLVFHGSILFFLLHNLIYKSFRDEIYIMGLVFYVDLLLLLPIACCVSIAGVSFVHLIESNSPFTLFQLYRNSFLAMSLFWVIPWLKSNGKKFYPILSILTYIGATFALIYVNYPLISDYGAGFALMLSIFLVIIISTILFIASYEISFSLQGIKLKILVSLFLLVIPWGINRYNIQDVRMLIYEYSKIGWAQIEMVKTFLPSAEKKGFGPDTTFVYHPEVYNTFTEPPLEFKTPPPIFIFLSDALRPDHTNLVDYPREVSPNIKKLGQEGVFFSQAYSCATGTSCSLRHLFSGQYSTRFMLEQEKIAPFWIQELIEAGYGTFVLNTFGLDYNGISLQSFQRHIPETTLQKANFIEVMTYAELPKIKEMLVHFEKIVQDFKEHPEKKNGIFCYIHSSITHMPWIPKKPIFGNETIDLYDASVKDVDDLLGFFLEELKKLGLYDDAIIIILADHGTGLMEHGRYGSFLNYEEQIRVPLLFRIPNAGIKPHVSSEFVQLIDLGPTLINMVSNVKKNRFHGISLLGAIRGKPLPEKREYLFALSSFEDLYSLIAEEKYKFHYHRRYGYYKLYDLSQDPMERNNLADQKKDLVEKYFSVMDQFLRAGNYSYNNPYHYKDFDPKNQ